MGLQAMGTRFDTAAMNDSFLRRADGAVSLDPYAAGLDVSSESTVGAYESTAWGGAENDKAYEKGKTRYNPDGSKKELNADGTEKSRFNPDGTLKTADAEKADKTGKLGGAKGDKQSETQEHIKHKHDGFDKDCPLCECETCKNRRYQDGSNDSTVSFQNPTAMSPQQASSKVRSHEMEHVRHEQQNAKEDGQKIVSQSVRIKMATCPECGKRYVSGGETRTTKQTVNKDFRNLFRVGAEDIVNKGEEVDASA